MARPWHCGCARQRNFTNANIYCSPTIRGKFPGLNQEHEPSDYRTLVGSLDTNAEIEAPVKCAMAEVHGTGHERVSKLAQPDRLTGVYRCAGQGQLVSIISSLRHQDSYRSWMTAKREQLGRTGHLGTPGTYKRAGKQARGVARKRRRQQLLESHLPPSSLAHRQWFQSKEDRIGCQRC